MSRSDTRKILVVPMLFAIAFTASCGTPGEKHDYLTVAEVWERAEFFDGRQIRVRGYRYLYVQQSLVHCEPARCNRNDARGYLFLLEEELASVDIHTFHKLDPVSIEIPRSEMRCYGNECSIDCEPFDPSTAKEFELVGTLRVVDKGSGPDFLYLEDLDLEASRQLIDAEWIPLRMGSFTVVLRDE